MHSRLRDYHDVGAIGLLWLALAAMSLFFGPSVAAADTQISEPGEGAGQTLNPQGVATNFETGQLYVADSGNRRVDVFSSAGAFEMAFGWGVRDGAAELQTCGPAATPPIATCKRGLEGGGAGEFTNLGDIAVDNDPASPSQGDIYVVDQRSLFFVSGNARVQKFDPDGNFLLAFGGGVIGGGASGTGNLTTGSVVIGAVQTTAKAFETGQAITGAGIPAGTRILALGPGTITLSKAATASGSGVALSVAAGPGNIPLNERQIVTIVQGAANVTLRVETLAPSPTEAFAQVDFSNPPPASGPGSLQASLEALSNVGPGNVAVSGPTGGPYVVEFGGPRFADTPLPRIAFSGGGFVSILAAQKGGSGAEICTAANAATCSGGVAGKGHGQFAVSPHLAVGPGGTVYVADCIRAGASELSPCDGRIQKFEPSGAFVEELALPQIEAQARGVAVDSNEDFYVTAEGLRKYDSSGSLLAQLSAERGAIAVDPADSLFAAEADGLPGPVPFSVIAEYDAAGNTLRRFGYGTINEPHGLAAHPTTPGATYSAEQNSVFLREAPPAGPVVVPVPCKTSTLSSANATLAAEVNPEGKATTFHFQYIDEASFQTEGGYSSPNTKVSPESASVGSDFFLHAAAVKVAGLDPETTYHCRVVAKNADAEVTGTDGTFKTREGFEFGPAWPVKVGQSTATLAVEGNPLGTPATGQIEYVTDAQYALNGFEDALSAPTPEIDFGEEEGAMQLRSADLSGLVPGTLYHWRLRARNGTPPEGIVCPEQKAPPCPAFEHTFRTYLPEATEADDRGYELVSPAAKNSAEVAVPGRPGGVVENQSIRIQSSSGSGEAVTYTSWTSFGEAKGAPAASQYLSKRGPEGWSTENISPFGFQLGVLFPPFTGFTKDLGFGAFKVSSPALTPECPEGFESLYLRNNSSGGIQCLTPEAPSETDITAGCRFAYAGASEDGSRVFFASGNSYAGAPSGSGFNLYEWAAGDGLRLVSVLPAPPGGAAPVANKTSFGPAGENCQTGQKILRHAISADGSRAFWTYRPTDTTKPSQLFARVNHSETIQLDALPDKAKGEGNPGIGPAGNGIFWAASADGSVIYFTDEGKLTSNSKAEAGAPDLYRYELGAAKPLTNVTKGSQAGDVRGVVGASEDGSTVYFVAGALLGEAGQKNSAGLEAQAGEPNLYLYREGKVSFVATLADGLDQGVWESQPKGMAARVSPDGSHLAFLSIEAQALAGYDNTIASGEHCQYDPIAEKLEGSPLCAQVLLFDADTNTLRCASCNPGGSRPLGPTLLPGWTNPYEGPRILSDDGSRVFFESYDALLPGDESLKRDVYEFELPGAGSCSTSNPNYDPRSGGCHFLISSGRSSDENYLVDASADGRDALFSTRSALVGWDTNENFDVYDYRVGGGFAEPPTPVPCEGDSCNPPEEPLPALPSPSTPNFTGPGNAKPVKPKPKKNKHKKHKKKHKGKKHKKKNAKNKKRSTGR